MLVEDTWNDAVLDSGRALWGVDLTAAEYQPSLEPPGDPRHGDATSGVCLRLARTLRKPPRKIAEELAEHLRKQGLPYVEAIEIAGPGFVNFRATPDYYLDTIRRARTEQEAFGRSAMGEGTPVLVEHTSANPTGPLHIAHGRQAAIGDTVARILEYAGYRVQREFYLNDAGNQIRMLGKSIYLRYLQSWDPSVPFPENDKNLYGGEYVVDLARGIRESDGEKWRSAGEAKALARFTKAGLDAMLGEIRRDLEAFRVTFENWYSEKELRESGRVEKVVEDLRGRGLTYEKDGALWLKGGQIGDIQDWVLIKESGEYTYRTPDFAYHLHKLERGFGLLIDLLGPDHNAHADTMKIVLKQFGHDALRVLFPQHCRLLRGGTELDFSKRKGNIVTLRELMDEVGVDAARYFFLMRRVSSHLDFDIEIAKKKTLENPVYYVQNAHARVCSVWKKGVEKGLVPSGEVRDHRWTGSVDGAVLGPAEIEVLREASRFRRAVEGAARDLEPSRLCTYLYDLAGLFHRYYQNRDNVILVPDRATRLGRMGMAAAIQVVLGTGLSLLGVEAPAWMEKLEESE